MISPNLMEIKNSNFNFQTIKYNKVLVLIFFANAFVNMAFAQYRIENYDNTLLLYKKNKVKRVKYNGYDLSYKYIENKIIENPTNLIDSFNYFICESFFIENNFKIDSSKSYTLSEKQNKFIEDWKYIYTYSHNKVNDYLISGNDTIEVRTTYFKHDDIIDSIVKIKHEILPKNTSQNLKQFYTTKMVENFVVNKLIAEKTYNKNLIYSYKKADGNGNLIFELNYLGFINRGSLCNRKYSDTSQANILKIYYDKLNRRIKSETYYYKIVPNQAEWIFTNLSTYSFMYKPNGLMNKKKVKHYDVKNNKIKLKQSKTQRHRYWYY